ncbi:MAG: GNAT family N-acetyltransferase [Dysgonamonadaceae bacterium]|jgi:GNAT superfamily N-acetyltransferase|nr:GNAT family N-acetyltransferase [Dysgonamonadaceae bacterium]
MESRKTQIINLWRTVFDDSGEFLRLYFSKVYRDENTFVIEKNGQVVSALQLLPYTMSFCGEEISVAYISGACTLPSEQGKGWMSRLLQDVSAEMRKRRVAVGVLIPAGKGLFDYYRSKGYTEIFDYSLGVYARSKDCIPPAPAVAVQQKKEPDKTLYAYFARKQRERPLGVLHSYEDFAVVLKDMELSGNFFYVASDLAGQPVGMAFAFLAGGTGADDGRKRILIKEILYDGIPVRDTLLHEITVRLGADEAVYRIPCDRRSPTYPYGMAQVTDPERLINLWIAAHPESKLSANCLQAMDTPALTRHLLGYPERKAYMSLMLD